MHLGLRSIRATLLLCFFTSVSNAARVSLPQEGGETAVGEVEEPLRSQSGDFGLPDIELFLRAGRRIPPGLTATRERERERERTVALEQLLVEFQSDSRPTWIAAMHSIFSSRAARTGLWTAAAGVVGELGLNEFDEQLALGLGPDSPASVRLAASQAIARLYGVRPTGDSPFLRPFEPGPGTEYLLGLLRHREQETLIAQRELIRGNFERAIVALKDPNPKLREAAAEELAIAAAEPEDASGRLRGELKIALSKEASAHAFHAELEALLVLYAGLAPDAPDVANLRGYLLLRSGEAPQSFLYSLANGLARLPWVEGPAQPELNLRAAERSLANVLGRVAADPLADADVTSGVLAALEDLLSQVEAVSMEGGVEDGAWVRGAQAREPLLALLASPHVPDGVRRRAAETLTRVALAGDVQLILDVLAAETTRPGLKYVLLGTLASLTEELRGDAGQVVERLLDFLEDPDADLRRRALSFLGSKGVEDYMRTTDLARVVQRLEAEPIAELKSDLLALLKQYGGREMLMPLLENASFDELAMGSSTGVSELGDTLAHLSVGDPAAVMMSARRLANVADKGSRLARLLRCLQLAADLDEEGARSLRPKSHEELVIWSRAVRSSGVLLQDAFAGGEQFLDRLVKVHLPAVVAGGAMSDTERTHTLALFLSDLVLLGDREREQEALVNFATALRAAESNSEHFFAARVLRDRARFTLGLGYRSSALDDFGVLYGNAKYSQVLELSDLRTLAMLIAQVAIESEKRASEMKAFGVLFDLVSRAAWRDELGAVRLSDLTELSDRAIGSGSRENVGSVLKLLADLPTDANTPLPAENGATPDELPVWDGLDREPALFAALGELKARLRAAATADESSN